MMNEEIKIEEDEIRYCKNCFGYEPCLCNNSDYIKTWKFVYNALKYCKPTM